MTVLAMSRGELSRFATTARFRPLGRVCTDGTEGLISRKRGRPSNRQPIDASRERIVSLVREHYADFGPTLARAYLAKRHEIKIGSKILRQLMMAAACGPIETHAALLRLSRANVETAGANWCRSTDRGSGGSRPRAPTHPARLYRRCDERADAP